MRGRHLNLAARPFVNSRPVTRVTAALAILAVLFLAADALLFWRYFRRGEDQREQLRRVEEEIAAERREAARLAGELAAVDLDRLNRRADYLNHKIAERTFGWGLLFDRLAAILPGDVRLLSLTPRPLVEPGPRRADRSAAAGEERVKIEIQGAARRDEAILELLDALFADPAFASPNLAREARQQGEVSFSLSVVYRPSVAAAGAADGDAEGEGPAAGEGATPPAGGPAAGGPMTATTTATATPAGGGAPPRARREGAVVSRLGDLRGLRGLGGLGGLRRLRLGGRLGDRELWRRSVARWLPALAGLALALLLFAVYLGRFAGRVEVGEEALEGGRQQLAALLAERRRIESELARVGDNRTRLAQFYDQRLSTESRRLTRIIAEVKELARRSGLEPQAISYPDETIEDFGLRKRSFVFGVEGTYADLRKLINLLELSDSFLTLERVDLSGEGQRGGGRLRIDLGLSTLFATGEPAAPEPAAGAPAAAAPPEPITPGAPPAEAGSEVEG